MDRPDESSTPSYFVLLGLPRTGSNLTRYLAGTLDGVRCFGEVFGQNSPGDPNYAQMGPSEFSWWQRTVHPVRSRITYLERLLQSADGYDQVGAKILYNHLCWPTRGALDHPWIHSITRMRSLERWMLDNDVLVVALIRENLLKALVSRRLASRDGTWHSNKGERESNTIEIDCSTLLHDLEVSERQQEGALAVARRHRHVVLPFEVPIEERVEMLATALGRSVGEPAEDLRSRKQTSDDLSVVVENYAEVAAVLKGTRFERFLADTGPRSTSGGV
jgi:hypothetical protein